MLTAPTDRDKLGSDPARDQATATAAGPADRHPQAVP
jgi:hypothetical protein